MEYVGGIESELLYTQVSIKVKETSRFLPFSIVY